MFLIGAGWFFMSKSGKDRKSGHRIPQQPVPLQHQGRHEVITLIRRNQKIAAIKRYRELTGASLITAKEAVDSMAGELGL
jgi:ribosomal protein L7/L12 C-terminal domain